MNSADENSAAFDESRADIFPDLIKRQKKEKKDLQNKFTATKHAINKNDKKAKKELLAKINVEERELEEKHQKELAEHESNEFEKTSSNDKKIAEDQSKRELDDVADNSTKLSKAAKRRIQKEQIAKEHAQLLAESHSQCESSLRVKEREFLASILAAKNLTMVDIAADGDCLFNAISHQLKTTSNITTNARELRRLTVEFMLANRPDFEPFFHCDNADFDVYCDRMENTHIWGGQLELKALSMRFKRPISVIQASGSETLLGDQFIATSPIIITYLKHELDSGAHYNSTKPS